MITILELKKNYHLHKKGLVIISHREEDVNTIEYYLYKNNNGYTLLKGDDGIRWYYSLVEVAERNDEDINDLEIHNIPERYIVALKIMIIKLFRGIQ